MSDRSDDSSSASTSSPSNPVASQSSAAAAQSKFKSIAMPTPEQMMQEDIFNNCIMRTIFSGLGGGAMGAAIGIFSASVENAGIDGNVNDTNKSTRVVLKEMFLNMKDKSVSYAKGFAVFGAIYSFNECVIEKFRAKHDKVNPTLAGCITGATLAYGAGPKAMCVGCAVAGSFSLAIEHFLQS